ncbi:MAG: hypothetical protein ACLSHW_02350 [Lachnospiraceae bacterium]
MIGGRYERRNPFFENRIRIENDQINVETLAELLEDDAIRTHTFTGVVTGTFDNENEIRGKIIRRIRRCSIQTFKRGSGTVLWRKQLEFSVFRTW